MKYNCKEYIKLLNYQPALKERNKSLRTEDPINFLKWLE
jgi:hypothetical protein